MSTTDQTSSQTPSPHSVGDTLAGCYALSRRLEVADGAEVWLATDEVLGKDVSLHFIPGAVGKDSKALQELRLDIKKNRQLIHPNILRVYDLVEESDWVAISMDAFEGESLSRKVGLGKALTVDEVRPWAEQLATTLEEAHKINVLHRDLTPSSLFLTNAGKLLVANFGISRTIHEAQVRAGIAGAADAFTSPQLKEGKAATRTDDVYSLGAILFTALTGGAPAASPDVSSALQAAHVPAPWSTTIVASLDPKPESRPQSAAEFGRRLSAPVESAAVPAPAVPVAAPAPVAEPSAPIAGKAASVVAPVIAAAVSAPEPIAPSVEKKVESVAAQAPKPAPEPEPEVAPTPAPAPIPEFKLAAPTPAPVVSEPSPAPVTPTPEPAPAPIVADVKPKSEPAPVVTTPAAAEVPPPPPQPVEATPLPAPAPVPVAPEPPKSAPVISEPIPVPGATAPKTVEPVVELKPAAPVPAPAPEPAKLAAEIKPAAETSRPADSKPEVATPAVLKPWEQPAKEPRKSESSRSPALTSPAKGPDRPAPVDRKHDLYPAESKFPVTTLAAAAAIIIVVALIYHFTKSGKEIASDSGNQQPEKAELRSITPATPAPKATPAPPDGPVVQTQQPRVAAATPAPASTPAPTDNKAIADRIATLEKAKREAEEAEKTYAALQKQQQEAEAGVAEIQKSLTDKTSSIKAVKKVADEANVQRKKLEDDKKAAEAAALEAQKAAAEKARLAEISAKALLDMEKVNADKLSAPEKTEKEIADLQKALEEKQRAIADSAKALAEANAARQAKLTAISDQQREIERVNSSAADAQKQKEMAATAEAQKQKDAAAAASAAATAADAQKQKEMAANDALKQKDAAAATEKTKVDAELQRMKDDFQKRMEELESKRKQLGAPAAATPTPTTPTTPAPATPTQMASLTTPSPAPSTPIRMIPGATPAVTIQEPTAPVTPVTPVLPTGGGNSLGQKFVPVGDVDFCIWQTRLKDFEVFAKAVNLRSNSWKGPGFKQAPEHPVVNVSWTEAVAFCKWLTEKEHKEGSLPTNQYYRLPSDLEWSRAVGLPEESGKTPEMRDMGIPDVYPWGTAWPPPAGAGNYTGEETGSDVAIKGYDDGFAWTSPVGSFPPNKFGIYDMGGNVWQWCMDTWNTESKAKVLRGASWYNGALKLSLLSSCRVHAAPDSSTDNYGFRIVRAKESAAAPRR